VACEVRDARLANSGRKKEAAEAAAKEVAFKVESGATLALEDVGTAHCRQFANAFYSPGDERWSLGLHPTPPHARRSADSPCDPACTRLGGKATEALGKPTRCLHIVFAQIDRRCSVIGHWHCSSGGGGDPTRCRLL
jgi:hypothetical protein